MQNHESTSGQPGQVSAVPALLTRRDLTFYFLNAQLGVEKVARITRSRARNVFARAILGRAKPVRAGPLCFIVEFLNQATGRRAWFCTCKSKSSSWQSQDLGPEPLER